MEWERVFAAGTVARCNRCDQPASLPRDIRGEDQDGSGCIWRLKEMCTLACGHTGSHWVYVAKANKRR